MDKEILSPDEAQSLGLQFIRSKYYRAQATINEVKLVTEGAFPVYHLEGSIKMPSRDRVSKLFTSTPTYTLNIKVHASDGSILGYEMS